WGPRCHGPWPANTGAGAAPPCPRADWLRAARPSWPHHFGPAKRTGRADGLEQVQPRCLVPQVQHHGGALGAPGAQGLARRIVYAYCPITRMGEADAPLASHRQRRYGKGAGLDGVFRNGHELIRPERGDEGIMGLSGDLGSELHGAFIIKTDLKLIVWKEPKIHSSGY